MEIEQIYGNLPILETNRLILRKITLDDVEDMYVYGSDDEVTKHVTWDTHKTISDTKAFAAFVLNKYQNKEVVPWGIELKENGKFIGTIDFVSWTPHHKTAEIGYVISKDYWGKGITTEAANEIIKFGFHKMDLVRIEARCFVENIGSMRVMEKCGMSEEGLMKKAMLVKGKHRDLRLYAILKEEF